MKTKVLLLLCVGFQSVALAASPSFSGFYASLDLGGSQSLAKVNKQTVANTLPAGMIQTIFSENDEATNVSALAGLSLGYNKRFNQHLIVGVEARAHFNSLKTTLESHRREVTSQFSQKGFLETKLRNDFALLAKVGAALNDKTSFYGLIGASFGNIKKSARGDYSHNVGVILQSSIQSEKSSYETGFTVAIGSEYFVTPCMSMGLEYNYTNYGSLKFDNPITSAISINSVVDPTTNYSLDQTTKLSINKVLLRFTYHFG